MIKLSQQDNLHTITKYYSFNYQIKQQNVI